MSAKKNIQTQITHILFCCKAVVGNYSLEMSTVICNKLFPALCFEFWPISYGKFSSFCQGYDGSPDELTILKSSINLLWYSSLVIGRPDFLSYFGTMLWALVMVRHPSSPRIQLIHQ